MADEETKKTTSVLKFSQTRIIAGLVILAVVGGVLSAVMMQAGGAQKALLYSGLDLNEASEIAGRLDQANISYELRGDGSSVFVERKSVLDARLMLSAEGLPTRGSVGYEIFDKQDALGATSFVQNVNRLRALEGELARTINSLENVKSSRVHLVLPERRLFERDERNPSASIMIEMVGRRIDGGQIRAIRNLAAGAVPGLEPDNVTILDSRGQLLAAASAEDGSSFGGMSADERRAMIEEELRQKVLSQLEPVVGRGAARVQVSADVDFNRITRASELFDPDGRVVRSTQTVEENDAETIRGRQDAVTIEENLPDADQGGVDGPTEDAQRSRIEETVNYEISKTTQTEIVESGTIQRLSVAVAVDFAEQIGAPTEEGEATPLTFIPRSEEEMAQLTAMVRSAVGLDGARGDVLEIVNIRFAQTDLELGSPASEGFLGFTGIDVMRIVEVVALLLGGIALIFFVLRPLIAGLLSPPKRAEDANGLPALPNGAAGPLAVGPTVNAAGEIVEQSAAELEQSIDIANVSGQVKASSMRKIAEMIEEHPDESVSILRTWLNEAESGAA